MHIPDPQEIQQSRIERMIDQVNWLDNTYPCCVCEERKDIDAMMPYIDSPDSPLVCDECLQETQKPVFGPWPKDHGKFKKLPF